MLRAIRRLNDTQQLFKEPFRRKDLMCLLFKADQGPLRPAWKDADIADAFDCTIKSVEASS
jgi:hypothetical protein